MPTHTPQLQGSAADSNRARKGFWTSAPGIVTELLGLAAAIVGLVAVTRGSSSPSINVFTGGGETSPVLSNSGPQIVPVIVPALNSPDTQAPSEPTRSTMTTTTIVRPAVTLPHDVPQGSDWAAKANSLCAKYLPVVAQLNASTENTIGDQAQQIQALGLDLSRLPNAPALADSAAGLLMSTADRYITAWELMLTDQQADARPILQEGFDMFKQALTDLVSAGADQCQ
jgi:hypothetical protein